MSYRWSISVYTDGACDNHGKPPHGFNTGMGVVVMVGSEYRALEAHYGEPGTSNVAEWLAMYRGLILVYDVLRNDFKESGGTVVIRTDSMLVVKQMNKEWLVNDPVLAHYFRGCVRLVNEIENLGHDMSIRWIPREENEVADWLSKIGRRTLDVPRPSMVGFKSIEDVKRQVAAIYGKQYEPERDYND